MIMGRILKTTKRWCMGGVVVSMIMLGAQVWAIAVSNEVIDVSMSMEGEVQGVDKHGNAIAAPVNLTNRDLVNLALGLRPRTHVPVEAVLGLVQLDDTNTLPLIVFDAKNSSNLVTVGTVTLDPAHLTGPKSNATLFAQIDLLDVGGVSNRIVIGQLFFAGTARFITNGLLKTLSSKGVGTLTAQFNATNSMDVLIYKAQFHTQGGKLGILTNNVDFSIAETRIGGGLVEP